MYSQIEATPGTAEFWVETCFDMLFLVDIAINFNSAYHTESGIEVRRSEIAKNYMKGWFLIDAPSSLPTEPVMELVKLALPTLMPEEAEEGAGGGGGSSDALMLPKLLRFLRMARFMKLIRLLKAAKIFKVMEEELDLNMSMLKLFKLIFIVVFLGHILACGVFMINKVQDNDNFGMFRLPTWYGCWNYTTQEYVTIYPLDWGPSPGDVIPEWPTIDDCNAENSGTWRYKKTSGELYVWVLYWTITTMTTIGYGDFSPLTATEAIITIFVEVLGASIFGYMIGNIASVIADFDQFGAEQKQRLDQIKSYLAYKKVPKTVAKQVRKYYGHFYEKKGVDPQDWSTLPPRMKIALVRHENKEFVTLFPAFLSEVSSGFEFIEYLVRTLRPTLVPLGELAAGLPENLERAEKPTVEFFCITSGEIHKMRFDTPDEARAKAKALAAGESSPDASTRSSTAARMVCSLHKGEWFGHSELLELYDREREQQVDLLKTEGCRWRHQYKARKVCELLYLIDVEFFEMIDNFPDWRNVLVEGDEEWEEGDEEDEGDEGGGAAAPSASGLEIEEIAPAEASSASSSLLSVLSGAERPPPVAVGSPRADGGAQPGQEDDASNAQTPVVAPPPKTAPARAPGLAALGGLSALKAAAVGPPPPEPSAPPEPSMPAAPLSANADAFASAAMAAARMNRMARGSDPQFCGGVRSASCGVGGMMAAAGGANKTKKPSMQGAKAAGGGGGGGSRGKASFSGKPGGAPGSGGSRWASLRNQLPLVTGISPEGQRAAAEGQRAAEFLRQKIMTEILGQPLRPGWEITDEEVVAAIRDKCGLPTPAATPAPAASTEASTPVSTPLPKKGLGALASMLAGTPAPECTVNGPASAVGAPGEGTNEPQQSSRTDTAPGDGEPPGAQS